jgi:hypothetical protein
MKTSTQRPISDGTHYGYIYLGATVNNGFALAPNRPTPEAVAKAQFVDKTYVWKEAAPKAQLP